MLYYVPYIRKKYLPSILLLYLFVVLRSEWYCDDVPLCVVRLIFVMMIIVYCMVMRSIARCGWISQETCKTLVEMCLRSRRGENPRPLWRENDL